MSAHRTLHTIFQVVFAVASIAGWVSFSTTSDKTTAVLAALALVLSHLHALRREVNS